MNDEYGVNESESSDYQMEDNVTFSAVDQKLEIMGLIAMISGIVGLPIAFCCSIFALPFPIVSIVLGMISLNKIKKQPDDFKGKGFALTGIILGVFVILLAIAMFIVGLYLQKDNQNFFEQFNIEYNKSMPRK